MFVTKCDICKKQIRDEGKSVSAGFGNYLSHYSFCEKCGKPIQAFLTKNKLKNRYETKSATSKKGK